MTPADAARELLARRHARRALLSYILYTTPGYVTSLFAESVCAALDEFIEDVNAGKRPVLILQAPPQHGKSEIVSRKLPAYLLGKYPDIRIAAASYSATLAGDMSTDVRRNLTEPRYQKLFPPLDYKRKYTKDRIGTFTSPTGNGSYIGDGVGGGFTGRPADIFIIDDPIKNAEEALSATTKESVWNWYQSTARSRLSANSGVIVMATSWAQDDLPGRIAEQMRGNGRFKHLKFPAINHKDEAGYNPLLPEGALIPKLHPLEQMLEEKAGNSEYWWSAIYQQTPQAMGGNVFKEKGVQFYKPNELPKTFDRVIASWDCTFKDTDGTDFVVGQVWGKKGANSYLLDQRRERMGFTATAAAVIELRRKWPQTSAILIEDKANGPAVIDYLKAHVPGLIPVEPDGSKLARAYAVTSYWEALNIWLPYESITPWMREFVAEVTYFPAAAHDDQVDAMTQALRYLYPKNGPLNISTSVINRALGLG